MNTIEERASEFGKSECGDCMFICSEWKDENRECSRVKSKKALYTHIATEQKAIDIEKVCDWLDTNITCMDDETRAFFLMRFRKAMEE